MQEGKHWGAALPAEVAASIDERDATFTLVAERDTGFTLEGV